MLSTLLFLAVLQVSLASPQYGSGGYGGYGGHGGHGGSNYGGWQTAYSKASAAVGKLNVTEKVNIVTGVGWQKWVLH